MAEEMRGWIPTGKFLTVLNPRKLWFQVWMSDYVTIEVYSKVNADGEKELRAFAPNLGYGFSVEDIKNV